MANNLYSSAWGCPVTAFVDFVCRSELAAATQKRLDEAAKKKEEEEREKAAQRHVRRDYKCAPRHLRMCLWNRHWA